MNFETSTWLAILSGLITAIPLVAKLVKYVVQATKEKNWNKLLSLTMSLMAEAEKLFQDGADKKRWVLAMIKASADSINYEIDESEISKMIDELCAMTKVVNPPSVNEPVENSEN